LRRPKGQIRGTNAGKAELEAKGIKAPAENADKDKWEAYNKKLAATSSYQTEQAKWGTGSAIQQGMQAATAVSQGL
jgi:filamentous hemagglutinin